MPVHRGHKFAAAGGAVIAAWLYGTCALWAADAAQPAAPARTPAATAAVAPAAPAAATPPAPAAAATPDATAAPAPAAGEQLEIRRNGTATSSPTPARETGTPPAPPTASSSEVGKVMAALALVIGLIFALKWGGRKMLTLPGAASSSHLMRVVARTPIAPKQSVLLLRVGQRLMVVGDSGGTLSSLGQITEPDEVAALLGQAKTVVSTAPANFGGMLRKLSQRFRGADAAQSTEEELPESDADAAQERNALLGKSDISTSAAIAEAQAPQIGLDDAAAQEAVEAARRDVQTLREKLREISQKMGTTGGTPATDGAGQA